MAVRTTRMVLSATVPVIAVLLLAVIFRPHQSEPNRKSGLLRYQDFENGDIIFQTSRSSQSQAIQQATHSRYSHMGIIFREGRAYYVYEAVQPVKITPLSEWIRRGEQGHYVVKRLKDTAPLTPAGLAALKKSARKYLNRDYDGYFGWSDDKIYCSELVWKVYDEALGIKLATLQQLKDFDLGSVAVKEKLKERYGDNVPLTGKVISPAAIFDSEKLIVVAEN